LQAKLNPKFNKVFEKVVVINLARRTDRLESITKQLNAHNIEFELFEAVDGQELGVTGVVACAMSHRAVIEKYKDCQSLFIFEDDAEFNGDFNAKFDDFISKLPDDWQMLYLGSWPHSIIDIGIEGVRKTEGNILTHAYGAKREIFQDLIDASYDSVNPIDVAYGLLHLRVRTYMAHPSFVIQTPGFSDIRNHDVNYINDII
jgi:GR25 family glycosyltransferase involved in LPS biosynthesis